MTLHKIVQNQLPFCYTKIECYVMHTEIWREVRNLYKLTNHLIIYSINTICKAFIINQFRIYIKEYNLYLLL